MLLKYAQVDLGFLLEAACMDSGSMDAVTSRAQVATQRRVLEV